MNDESLKRERYLCANQGGIDGLLIADLFYMVEGASMKRPVILKSGDYVPTELLNFNDIKISRLTGALKRCIDRGWIVVENPAFESKKEDEKVIEIVMPRKFEGVTEIEAGIIRPSQITNPVASSAQLKGMDPYPIDRPVPFTIQKTEAAAKTANAFAITEKEAQKVVTIDTTYEEFSKLRYFQKLKAIKDMKDKPLLQAIISKASYPQLVHNAQLRIKEISNGA